MGKAYERRELTEAVSEGVCYPHTLGKGQG
jgi:hypothetical protein